MSFFSFFFLQLVFIERNSRKAYVESNFCIDATSETKKQNNYYKAQLILKISLTRTEN